MFYNKKPSTLTLLLAMILLASAAGPSAQAVTYFEGTAGGYAFADVATHPNSPIYWNQPTITYKLDDTFKSFWPDPLHQSLVKQAFTLWGQGATRDYGTVNSHLASYPRWGEDSVYDIATLALHELGHGVGLGHPFQGAAASPQLNFHFDD